MEYRNIFIANPARLSVTRGQLVIEQAEKITVPLEDISAVLVESHAVQISAAAIAALANQGVTVFFCNDKHLPNCQILPINQFCRQRKMLMTQCSISKPLQKQLWQQIVMRKIKNQAKCLQYTGRDGADELGRLADAVLSGDKDNREAVAAALYFPALFGKGFSRSSDDIRNAALNYGYAILRGTVARNLVIHGLEPCIGLHHRSELNNFNLADDLIEPFRPIVDLFVAEYVQVTTEELTPKLKAALFNVTNYMVKQANKKYRVMLAAGRSCESLAACLQAESGVLELPELLPLEMHHYE